MARRRERLIFKIDPETVQSHVFRLYSPFSRIVLLYFRALGFRGFRLNDPGEADGSIGVAAEILLAVVAFEGTDHDRFFVEIHRSVFDRQQRNVPERFGLAGYDEP